ncbi:hypothetical protein [Methylobacterium sp. J-070]|uniref:hypothetical protein n=1 Tax=Methylobacterium sp. J-070 TaxID=2836650 RepID=UPI001FBBA9A4|nr:hypothetical protein [Methylobacterium sp. J-070]MCJ2051689.1 hypothetical protein [Methylobacterium sp. J-070]
MSDDDGWTFVPDLMKPGPPFDGTPVRLRLTLDPAEFEARFTQPDVASTDPANLQVIQKSWTRSDGQPMPGNDPPRFWKPI